jgi:hypothetical protein
VPNLIRSKLPLLAAAAAALGQFFGDLSFAILSFAILKVSGDTMIRTAAALLSFFAVAACASAQIPTTWTRTDGRATDQAQLEADGAICRGEMEQAQLVTKTRGLVPIQLPGQENPLLKVYVGCMARHGYAAAKSSP